SVQALICGALGAAAACLPVAVHPAIDFGLWNAALVGLLLQPVPVVTVVPRSAHRAAGTAGNRRGGITRVNGGWAIAVAGIRRTITPFAVIRGAIVASVIGTIGRIGRIAIPVIDLGVGLGWCCQEQ